MSSESPACLELRAKAPSNWSVESLEKVTDFQEGPGILAKDFRESGVPLLRLRNIETPRVQLGGCNFLDPEKVNTKWKHFGLRQGDFLISTSASLGRVSVVGPEAVDAIAYTGIIRFRSRSSHLHHEYLRAFLSSRIFVEQAERMATGSVIKHFGPSHLKQMAITLPPIETQVQIAQIFDVLDDRITLLRETNTTLEAIAQALFKSWFVDFYPVHAKMQGLALEGMDEATAALFPDSFEESELGDVPKGWRSGDLNTLAELNPESWSTKHHPGRILYVDLANTKAGQIDDYIDFSFEEAPSRARRALRSGDVIVGTVRPGNRSFARIASDVTGLTGSTGFAVLRSREVVDQALVYLAATNDEAIDRLSHLADGGAYPAVRPEVVGTTPLVIAPEAIRNSFGEIANPLFASIGANQDRMKQLASLRDTLLSRLISGQISLSEFTAETI
jgi:type I restriction enzyme S subunit